MFNKDEIINRLVLLDYLEGFLIKEKECLNKLEMIPDYIFGVYSMYFEKSKSIVNKYIDMLFDNNYSKEELRIIKGSFLVEYKYCSNCFGNDLDKYILIKKDKCDYGKNILLGNVLKLKLGELIATDDIIKRIERKPYVKPKRKYVRRAKNI